MRLRLPYILACLTVVLVLTGCSRAKTFDSVVVRPKLEPGQMTPVSPIAAADRALEAKYARDREIVVLTMIAARTTPPTSGSFRHVEPRPPSMTDAASFDWSCVSRVETGNDVTMHGPRYSSQYGVMNEAVRENTDPATAARILAGQASPGEQLAMAESIVRKHSVDAWAPGTVERCAR